MIRVLHCADLHLDTAFSLHSPRQAERHRTELRSDLSTITLMIRTQHIQICLISGDMFDGDFVSADTRQLLERELAGCPECRFFIAPGNHDPLTASSPYKSIKFPSNVFLFESERSCVHLDDLDTDVYGYAFDGSNGEQNPVRGWQIQNPDRINLLCVHGDLDVPGSVYGPCSKKDIGNSGFDYVALGHIHKGSGLQCEDGVFWAYPGCVEGRGFDETGYKGVLIGTIEKGKADLQFVRVSKRRYESVDCDISGCDRRTALETVRALVRSFGDDTVLRVTLTGTVKNGILLLPEELMIEGTLSDPVEIIDKTVLEPDFTELESSSTLKGVFYRLMREKIEQGTATEEALKYGLLALDGQNIADYEEDM